MAYDYDLILRSPSSERTPGIWTDSYYFVNTSKKDYFRIPNRYGFVAVSFSESHKDCGYPIVFDDYTTNSHIDPLEVISYQDVPAKIKRKLTNWLKYQ
jgi:hypothetical protein